MPKKNLEAKVTK